jgi:hypothetical protein
LDGQNPAFAGSDAEGGGKRKPTEAHGRSRKAKKEFAGAECGPRRRSPGHHWFQAQSHLIQANPTIENCDNWLLQEQGRADRQILPGWPGAELGQSKPIALNQSESKLMSPSLDRMDPVDWVDPERWPD